MEGFGVPDMEGLGVPDMEGFGVPGMEGLTELFVHGSASTAITIQVFPSLAGGTGNDQEDNKTILCLDGGRCWKTFHLEGAGCGLRRYEVWSIYI